MNSTPLSRVLAATQSTEDTKDRYRTCCYYCRDYIIFRHESDGRPSNAQILRDLKKADPYPCTKCPYHPDIKAGHHKKGDFIPSATCRRNREYMLIPNCNDTVDLIVSRIPAQQDCLAWEGVRSWESKFLHKVTRKKPDIVNHIWFSDHTKLNPGFPGIQTSLALTFSPSGVENTGF